MKNIHDKIWESALRSIEIRPHSIYELKRKLAEKFPDDEGMILKVIEEMEGVQLLSDRRFAEEFVHHLIQKNIGRIKIEVETRRKGLGKEAVEQILLDENWDEAESAKKALDEKESRINETDPRRKKMKLMNFLRNRGFRDEVIYKILREE
jgi:SOS response regulatory protein OraA/RecX